MKFNKESFIAWATDTVVKETARKYTSHILHLNKKYRFDIDGDVPKTKQILDKVLQLEEKKAVHHNFVSAWKKLIDWKISASELPTVDDVTSMLAKNIVDLVQGKASQNTVEQAINMSSKVLSELS